MPCLTVTRLWVHLQYLTNKPTNQPPSQMSDKVKCWKERGSQNSFAVRVEIGVVEIGHQHSHVP